MTRLHRGDCGGYQCFNYNYTTHAVTLWRVSVAKKEKKERKKTERSCYWECLPLGTSIEQHDWLTPINPVPSAVFLGGGRQIHSRQFVRGMHQKKKKSFNLQCAVLLKYDRGWFTTTEEEHQQAASGATPETHYPFHNHETRLVSVLEH